MKNLSAHLKINKSAMQTALPSPDVLVYEFVSGNGTACAVFYADGMADKVSVGELIVRPLTLSKLPKLQNEGGRCATNAFFAALQGVLLFPEIKKIPTLNKAKNEVLDGNVVLFIDGFPYGISVGTKRVPARSVTEPPTDVTVKGPREGFVEDIKTNAALLRKRIKTANLQLETLRIGRQSNTAVTLCYIQGIADKNVLADVKTKLRQTQIDAVIDSSYIAALLSPRRSVFRTVGTTEKPDIFAAKLCEGRIGILVDGSPIALTLPFLLTEDLQSSEDYFISPFMATVIRLLRTVAVIVAMLLPAFYVSVQLFKMQLLPLGLMLTVASSIRGIPLSPSLEMFVVLLLLEILKEASIRMPKYVGLSLSVVGALVLGETAVSAGFLSTPAIIIVAFSGICMYTVPNFVETGSILRWLFLLIAGSIGPLGIVLLIAFLLYYLISADAYGTPPLAPFSPLIAADLRDSFVKYNLFSLRRRPKFLHSKNKTRLKTKS